MNLKEIVAKYPTHEDFTKAVEEQLLLLAKEQPDFRYNTSGELANCKYNGPAGIYDGEGNLTKLSGPECEGCLFGQALQNLGWTDPYELKSGSTIDGLLEYWVESDRLLIWRSIQNEQDGGKTWSEAVSVLTSLSANAPATEV